MDTSPSTFASVKAQKESGKPAGANKPWHLAILISHPIQYYAPLYRRLARESDIDFTVLYCSRAGLDEYIDINFGRKFRWDVPLSDGYEHRWLPNLRGGTPPGGFFSLINPTIVTELIRGNYDALWVYGHNYATNMLAMLAARIIGLPVFMTSDTHLGLSRPGWKRRVRKPVMTALYRYLCAAALPVGTRNREFCRAHGVPPERTFLVPYAVDFDFFASRTSAARVDKAETRRSFGLNPDKPVILYASKLTRRKRAIDLVQAHERLRKEGVDVSLLIVGSGEQDARLRAYMSSHAIPDIVFAGFRNQSQLPAAFAAADVFVLPSEDEPWGLILNEVMSAGLPIVASAEIGGVADLVRDRVNGRLFPVGDVAALTACLREVLDDESTRHRMGDESQRIIAGWSYDVCVAGIRDALATVVPQPHVPSAPATETS